MRIWSFARRAIGTHEEKRKHAAPILRHSATRESFQYACWYYDVSTPELREDAERWVHLCEAGMNEGVGVVMNSDDPIVAQQGREDAARRVAEYEAKKKARAGDGVKRL